MTDPIAKLAVWLAGHVEWMRHRPEADEFLAAVDACARVIRGLARGPGEQKYLGECGAVLAATAQPCPGTCTCRSGPRTALSEACAACSCFTACHPTVPTHAEGQTCTGDMYAYRGAKTGRCRSCGATVATAEREAWLDDEVRQHAFRASAIADAYGISVDTIRSWARRGRLKSYWRTDAGIVAEWTDPPDGEKRERLHYVGDVLDLAAADAARRETERARRERRRTTRHEGDAA